MAKSKTDLDILGSNIAKYRKEKKLTQEKMAELLYISDKTISKWETGRSGPDVMIISDVADVLGVEVNDLLNGTSKHNKDRKSKFILNWIFFGIFMIVFLLLLYVEFNSWDVYDFKSTNENFYVSGYVVSNKDSSRVVVDSFSSINYLEKMEDISYAEIKFYINDEIVYTNEFNIEFDFIDCFISDINNFSFRIPTEIEGSKDFENSYIIISYSKDDSPVDVVINLE